MRHLYGFNRPETVGGSAVGISFQEGREDASAELRIRVAAEELQESGGEEEEEETEEAEKGEGAPEPGTDSIVW